MLLIASFCSAVLLLGLAAIPPSWVVHLGLAPRLASLRTSMLTLGAIILLESGYVALILAT